MDIWHDLNSYRWPIRQTYGRNILKMRVHPHLVLLYSGITESDTNDVVEELITLHGSLLTLLSESIQ